MVIDAHTHVGGLGYLDDTGESVEKVDPATIGIDSETRRDLMDRNGIDRAIIHPTYDYDTSAGLKATRALNDRMLELHEEFDRSICPVGTVEPGHGQDALTELERLADLGFRAIGWHHRFQRAAIDGETTLAAMDRLEDLDLAAFIHSYSPTSDLEHFDRLERVVARTNQPVIVITAFNHIRNVDKAIALAAEYDHVYFDTTNMAALGRPVEKLVRGLGAERLVLGTGLYTQPLHYWESPDLFQVRTARISESARHRILETNIREALNLPA